MRRDEERRGGEKRKNRRTSETKRSCRRTKADGEGDYAGIEIHRNIFIARTPFVEVICRGEARNKGDYRSIVREERRAEGEGRGEGKR